MIFSLIFKRINSCERRHNILNRINSCERRHKIHATNGDKFLTLARIKGDN